MDEIREFRNEWAGFDEDGRPRHVSGIEIRRGNRAQWMILSNEQLDQPTLCTMAVALLTRELDKMVA